MARLVKEIRARPELKPVAKDIVRLAAQVEQLTTDPLETLIESLFDMTAPEDLTAWFDREN